MYIYLKLLWCAEKFILAKQCLNNRGFENKHQPTTTFSNVSWSGFVVTMYGYLVVLDCASDLGLASSSESESDKGGGGEGGHGKV